MTRPLTVADVGCGTGIVTMRLAGPGRRVLGIDRSAGMAAVLAAPPLMMLLMVPRIYEPLERHPFEHAAYHVAMAAFGLLVGLGATRLGGIDLNEPRIRPALSAAVALAAAPSGFTVAVFTAKVRHLTRKADYTTRQAAYDLRKLRGKNLVVKPGRSRRYQTPAAAARTITALLALRDQVIAPIIAGIRSPRRGRKPATWTRIDRDYETLRIGMQTLFNDLGITPTAAAAA